jgi:hypothetical protein
MTMTSLTRRFVLAVAVLGLAAGGAGRARADIVTFNYTVTASGVFGTSTFTDALVTLTQVADTDDVTSDSGIYFLTPETSTVSVAGLGTATFTGPTFDASIPGGLVGLFSGTTAGPAILVVNNAAFAGYDLQGAIGPLSGGATINPGSAFATSSGDFVFGSTSGLATVQVTLGTTAVPEASTLAMGGLVALVGLGVARRRGRAA